MSRFYLIEIEAEKTPAFTYRDLDINRKTVFQIFVTSSDQYGNVSHNLLLTTDHKKYAEKYLRSLRLIDGIYIDG